MVCENLIGFSMPTTLYSICSRMEEAEALSNVNEGY